MIGISEILNGQTKSSSILASENDLKKFIGDDKILYEFIFQDNGEIKNNQKGLLNIHPNELSLFLKTNSKILHENDEIDKSQEEFKKAKTIEDIVQIMDKYPFAKEVYFKKEGFENILVKAKAKELIIAIDQDGVLGIIYDTNKERVLENYPHSTFISIE